MGVEEKCSEVATLRVDECKNGLGEYEPMHGGESNCGIQRGARGELKTSEDY